MLRFHLGESLFHFAVLGQVFLPFGKLGRELLFLAVDRFFFLEERLDACAIRLDVRFELRGGARFPFLGGGSGGDRLLGGGELLARVLEVHVQFRIGSLESGRLILDILEPARDFGLAFAQRILVLALEGGLLLLQLGRGFLLETVRRRELAFDLEFGFALAPQFLRVVALAGFQDVDAPLQFVNLPLDLLLRPFRAPRRHHRPRPLLRRPPRQSCRASEIP